jgi:uncharacterized protein
MLKLDFLKIANSQEAVTHLSRELTMTDDFYQRSHDLLYEVKSCRLEADFFYDQPFVIGDYQVKAEIVVPSSRSLKAVDLQQSFHFSESYSMEAVTKEELADDQVIVAAKDGEIDVQTAVEDNLLLSIPTTVLTPEEKKQGLYPSGQDWQVVSEDKFLAGKENQINPAFAKLKVLLDKKNQPKDK